MAKCVYCCERIGWQVLVCPKCGRNQQPKFWRHKARKLKRRYFTANGCGHVFSDAADFHVKTQKKRNKDAEETALVDRVVSRFLFGRKIEKVLAR